MTVPLFFLQQEVGIQLWRKKMGYRKLLKTAVCGQIKDEAIGPEAQFGIAMSTSRGRTAGRTLRRALSCSAGHGVGSKYHVWYHVGRTARRGSRQTPQARKARFPNEKVPAQGLRGTFRNCQRSMLAESVRAKSL